MEVCGDNATQGGEQGKNALPHYQPKVEAERSNAQATTCGLCGG
jgi:hypothetical protein